MVLAQNPSTDNKVLLNSYRDLGIIHLLSISGFTCEFIYLRYYMVRDSDEENRRRGYNILRYFLVIEILLSNFQAGFVRASLSYFWSVFFKKKRKFGSGDKLGIVVLTHLLFNPLLFLSSGAILSYLLVLGLEISKDFKKIRQNFALNLLITPIFCIIFIGLIF